MLLSHVHRDVYPKLSHYTMRTMLRHVLLCCVSSISQEKGVASGDERGYLIPCTNPNFAEQIYST